MSRVARGAALTVLAVALAALAHVAGGGGVPRPALLVTFGLTLLPVACACSRVRVLPGVTALGVVQVAGHTLLGRGSAGGCPPVHVEAHHAAACDDAAAHAATSPPMLVAHAAAVVLTVLGVAAAERALLWCRMAWAWVRAEARPLHVPAVRPPVPCVVPCLVSPHLRDVPPRRGPPVAPAAVPPPVRGGRRRAPPTTTTARACRARVPTYLETPMTRTTRPTTTPATPPSAAAARRDRTPRLVRTAAAAALLALPLTLLPTGAHAHVTVVPESTTAEGWTTLTFRVPNESATASTQGLTVELPTGTPLVYVSTKPVPGWEATIERAELPEPVEVHGTEITEAAVRVVWTATPGAEIGQGQFQEFEISAGPLPEAGTTLVLPADQQYSDGTVVSWDEVADGDEEPRHPAPTFTTTAAESDDADESEDAADEDASDAGTGDDVAATGADATSGVDPLARVLAGAALAAALVAAVLAWRRRPSA